MAQNAADFGDRTSEIFEVFQTVIGDDGMKTLRRKRKSPGVSLNEFATIEIRWALAIDADGQSTDGGKTSTAAAEIEDSCMREVIDDFVQT